MYVFERICNYNDFMQELDTWLIGIDEFQCGYYIAVLQFLHSQCKITKEQYDKALIRLKDLCIDE